MGMEIIKAERNLTKSEARKLTDAIRQGVAELELMIVQAWQGRAWLALGYDSWDDYVAGEFKQAPLALPREERRATVQSLRGWGMSTRAIAPVVGISQTQASDDSRVTGNRSPVTGLDGKTYEPRSEKKGSSAATDDPEPRSQSARSKTCPTCGGTGRVPR